MTIIEKYNARVKEVDSLACVGLDSDFSALPAEFKKRELPQFEFNQFIVSQTHELASAFKFNIAFYEERGDQGYRELKMSVDYLKKNHPGITLICDCKRGDVPNTNSAYMRTLFDWFGFDAVTLNPYLGLDALRPFLDRTDKACIILCRTSNPGAGEFQDLIIDGKPLWRIVAEKVSREWNKNSNCLLVMGATYPEEIKIARQITGEMTFLMPGLGRQGGSVEAAVKSGINSARAGLIAVSGRDIIFSPNPKEAILAFRDAINTHRKDHV